MFPIELDFYARQERCKDLLREAATERLAQEYRRGGVGQRAFQPTLMGWLGNQIAKLGSRLHHS